MEPIKFEGFRERLRVLFTGRIWLSIWTFHKPLSPHLITTRQSDLMVKQEIVPIDINLRKV